MKKIITSVLAVALLVPSLFSTPAYAVNERDCSIWLCLPMGFGSGCSDAKKAFVDRIKKFKPPLPNILSCMISSPDIPTQPENNMDAKTGSAAYVPAYMKCVDWSWDNNGFQECEKEELIPTHIVKDAYCEIDNDGDRTPEGCKSTINYVQTMMDGQPYGDIYYYDNKGNTYSK